MSLVSAYQFEIQPAPGQTTRQLLAAAREFPLGFVRDVYKRTGVSDIQFPFDGSCLRPNPAHELWTDQQECSSHRLDALHWELGAGPDPTLVWQFCVVLACDAQTVQAALTLHVAPRGGGIRQFAYTLDGANNPLAMINVIVTQMARSAHAAFVEGWPLRLEGRVLGEDDLEGFVNQTLLASGRTLPVVLLGPEVLGTPAAAALAVYQRRLTGLGEAALVATPQASDRLTELLGADRSLGDGVLRVYWPGFTREAPPDAHPVRTLAQWKQSLGVSSVDPQLSGELAAVAAARFREGRVIRAARAALAFARVAKQRGEAEAARRLAAEREEIRRLAADAAAEAARRVAAEREEIRRLTDAAAERHAAAEATWRQARHYHASLKQEYDEGQKRIRALQGELEALRAAPPTQPPPEPAPQAGKDPAFDELAAELESAWDENARLREERELARDWANELEADLRVYKENWAFLRESRAAPDLKPNGAPADERQFDSVAAALRAAAAEYADVLTVWEDALAAAEESLYPVPEKVFRALRAVAEIGRGYFRALNGGPPLGPVDRAFQQRVPFKYTGFESQTTRSLYGAERVFHHQDQSRRMERHLTLGGGTTNHCLQIYFDFDDDARRVLIGYCGRHLPFSRQRT